MKIDQKYASVFVRILRTKAAPRVLFGSPWSLPKRLRKRLRSRHSFLNLKYISVIENYTFAFMQKPSNHLCFTVFFTHATFFRRLLTCKQEVAKMGKFLCQNWSKIVKKSISEASQIWNHFLTPFLTRIFSLGFYFWPHFGTQNRFQSIQNGFARLQRFQECPRCLEKQVMMPQKCLKGPFNWSPKRLTTSSDTAFRLHCANALTLATVSNLTQQRHC